MFIRLLIASRRTPDVDARLQHPDLRRAQRLIRTQRAVDRLAAIATGTAAIAVSLPLALRPTATAVTLAAICAGLCVTAAAVLVVAALRRRLLDRSRRAQLAASLRFWATPRGGWCDVHPATRLPMRPRLDAATAHLMDALSERLLLRPPRRARPIAACELLLAAPQTPLFGGDRRALALELRRIHALFDEG
jgi:hypothetical protein